MCSKCALDTTIKTAYDVKRSFSVLVDGLFAHGRLAQRKAFNSSKVFKRGSCKEMTFLLSLLKEFIIKITSMDAILRVVSQR